MDDTDFTASELEEARRYRLEIQWSDVDRVFIVSLPELGGLSAHAATPAAAAERGVELAAEYLYGSQALGLPVPAPQSLAITR